MPRYLSVGVAALVALMAAHRATWVAVARLGATALLVVLTLWLTPIMGVTGVSAAVVAHSLLVALTLAGLLALVVRIDRRRTLQTA